MMIVDSLRIKAIWFIVVVSSFIHTATEMTAITRLAKTDYQGMAICKSFQETWTIPTMLVRMIDQNGTNTIIVATESAIPQFQKLELYRIVDFSIYPNCVKVNKLGKRYGVPGQFEVRVKYEFPMTIATVSWPIKIVYDWAPFQDLNQKIDKEYVDVLGRIISKEKILPTSANAIPKTIITLCDGELDQPVECLGQKSTIQSAVGDLVALKGARINEYNGKRTLSTGFMTHVSVNPQHIADIDEIPELDEIIKQPRQKAIKLTLPDPITVLNAKEIISRMLTEAQTEPSVQPNNFTLEGTFAPLTDSFFVDDAPLVGGEENFKICLKTKIADPTGDLLVKVWTKAASVMLNVSVESLKKAWEDGNSVPSDQKEILKNLNQNTKHAFQLSCTAKAWIGTKQCSIDVNVNDAEQMGKA